MNWLGVTYLILSGISFFVAASYAAQALAIRSDPAQPAIAAVGLGFGLFNLGIAFASSSTGAAHAPSAVWFVCAGLGLALLNAFVPVTAWALLDTPITRGRVAIAGALGSAGLLRMFDLLSQARNGVNVRWEGMSDSPIAVLAGVVAFAVAAFWAAESAIAVRQGRRYAVAMLVFGAVAMISTTHGLLVMLGVLPPPAYYGFAALPFVCFVQVLTSLRFVHALTTAQAPSGDMARYQVLERLGTGGMGDVFLARRRGPAGFLREVVLKTLHRTHGDAAANERFLAEARLAAQLRHPNIVDVYDLGEQPNGFFIVMERIEGGTLSEVIHRSAQRELPIACEVVAELGAQLCRALGYAHAAGVVHRDIKPQNVMVTFTGVAKLIDFGIAQGQSAHAAEARARAEAEGVVGTPGYMPPERWLGGEGSPASDLFALGVTLYQLLTLRTPFPQADTDAFITAVDAGSYAPLGTLRPDCPAALAEAVHQCLLPDAAERPASAASLNAMLEHSLVDKRVDLSAFMGTLFSSLLTPVAPDALPTTPVPRREVPTVSSR